MINFFLLIDLTNVIYNSNLANDFVEAKCDVGFTFCGTPDEFLNSFAAFLVSACHREVWKMGWFLSEEHVKR